MQTHDPLSFDVSGRHVLITGGTGGIGGAFAHAFTSAGAYVTVCDIKPPDQGAPALPLATQFEPLDVRDDGAIRALANRLGQLDVLIHCAGTLAPYKEHRPEVFADVVDVHLTGAMRLASAFRPLLKARRGCIIHIGSIYSFFGNARVPAYAAAKAAMRSLTQSLAIAYAVDGIRVNGIAPGWTTTEMTRGGQTDAALNAAIMARLPSGRWAEPMELAGTALFLASPASSLINGVMIPVDGGYSAG